MDTSALDDFAAGSYVLRPANSQTECDRCASVIAANEPAIRVFPWIPEERYRCFGCSLDCSALDLRYALRANALAFAERERVEKSLAERIDAMERRARGADVSCVPARDRQGRPRVRALIHGLVVSAKSKTAGAFWSELRAGCAFSSARREYAFHGPGVDDTMRSGDPAQPLVAYVYALNARPADKVTQASDNRTLQTCFARGFPPPLLWLQGVTEKTARDKHIPRAREIVSSVGFDADSCPVVCAKGMDRAAIETLVDALDEHFSGAEIAPIASKKCR